LSSFKLSDPFSEPQGILLVVLLETRDLRLVRVLEMLDLSLVALFDLLDLRLVLLFESLDLRLVLLFESLEILLELSALDLLAVSRDLELSDELDEAQGEVWSDGVSNYRAKLDLA
jgi:hypothetical protein